jgi:effector-binding domain-containing protein
MKALKIVGIVLVVLVVLIVVLGVFVPKEYFVERSVIIQAPKELVFMHAQFWKNWQAWSPWAKDDPSMQVTFEGSDGTKDSKYMWNGEKAGKGEMVNTGTIANSRMNYHLHFVKPWESESDGYVKVEDAGTGSKASWAFYGRNPFPWNVLSLFMNMDQMIGKDFERGLASLKEIAEKEAPQLLSYKIVPVDFPGKTFMAIRKKVSMSEIPGFFAQAFGQLMPQLEQKGVKLTGAPCGLYYSWDAVTMTTEMAAALPVDKAVHFGAGVETIILPRTKALTTDYYGPYDKTMMAYMAFDKYLKDNKLAAKPLMIEEYITDPQNEPDSSKLLTRIYYFIE